MDNKWTNRALTIKVIQHHCKHEHNWVVSRRMAVFLTLKCILLIWLNREYQKTDERMPDPVTVAIIDGGSYWSEWGTSYWYEYVGVGYGYFKNWWIVYDGDSSP